ncbi:glycosyltransferase [Vibrio metschnikovii]|nr:glycosyltransferase [Vibrio metschnikovii]
MQDVISIIVPVFNSDLYLKECVESILNQTYSNLELILVNDGSTDKSLDICKYYENLDKRVKLIDKINEGVSSARNDGIALATGKYIAFVDSDDFICENMFKTLISAIESSKSDCAVLSRYIVNVKDRVDFSDVKTISSEKALDYLLELKFPTSLWAYLYKAELVSNIRLNKDIHFFEDLDFNARFLLNSNIVSIVTDELYFYRTNPSSINRQGVTSKRLSCMQIPKLLHSYCLAVNNKRLIKKINYLEAYFILSTLEPLKPPINGFEVKYSKMVVLHARRVLLKVIISSQIPIKFKFFVFLVAINPILALKVRDSIRGRDREKS